MSGLRGDLGSSRLSPQRASGEMLEALLICRWVKFSQVRGVAAAAIILLSMKQSPDIQAHTNPSPIDPDRAPDSPPEITPDQPQPVPPQEAPPFPRPETQPEPLVPPLTPPSIPVTEPLPV